MLLVPLPPHVGVRTPKLLGVRTCAHYVLDVMGYTIACTQWLQDSTVICQRCHALRRVPLRLTSDGM
jgi:hypothetical protein